MARPIPLRSAPAVLTLSIAEAMGAFSLAQCNAGEGAERGEAGEVQRGSVQKITLRQGQHGGWLASQMGTVGAHLISLRVDFDMRCGSIMDHVALVDTPDAAGGQHHALQTEPVRDTALDCEAWQKSHRRSRECAAEGAEHRPVM